MSLHDKEFQKYNTEQDRAKEKSAEEKQRREDDRQDARQDARQELRAEARREGRDAARRARDEAITEEFPAAPAAKDSVSESPPAVPQEVLVIEGASKQISWLKVIVLAAVGLIGVGIAAGLYVSRFATISDLAAAIQKHQDSPGHPLTQTILKDTNDRLIRVEMIQQAVKDGLLRIERKVDQVLLSPLIAGPTGPTGAVGPRGVSGPAGPVGATGSCVVRP